MCNKQATVLSPRVFAIFVFDSFACSLTTHIENLLAAWKDLLYLLVTQYTIFTSKNLRSDLFEHFKWNISKVSNKTIIIVTVHVLLFWTLHKIFLCNASMNPALIGRCLPRCHCTLISCLTVRCQEKFIIIQTSPKSQNRKLILWRKKSSLVKPFRFTHISCNCCTMYSRLYECCRSILPLPFTHTRALPLRRRVVW